MKRVRALRTKASVFTGALLLGGLGIGAAAPAQAAEAYDCGQTNICFYTGYNGTGKKCSWTGYDPDWREGSTVCSWAADTKVKSVYNRGRSGMVVIYYSGKDYEDRIGCTKSGVKGNLAGTYRLRSHHWADEC